MAKIDFFRNKLWLRIGAPLLLFSLCLMLLYPQSGKKELSRSIESSNSIGKIIVLYGPHCGGKSTLAEELVKQLPEPYKIVSKRKHIDAKRSAYLAEVTGAAKSIDHKEMLQVLDNLPIEAKRDFSKEAIQDTLLEMRSRAEQGENLIFPVCFKCPGPIEIFKGIPHLLVLVHLPLSVVSKRELVRTKKRGAFAIQQTRRNRTLMSYASLYVPVRYGGDPYIDTLSYDDVIDFAYESLKRDIHSETLKTFPKAVAYFGLHSNKRVKIAPRFKPDLVINSGTHSPQELAEQIKELLYPKLVGDEN